MNKAWLKLTVMSTTISIISVRPITRAIFTLTLSEIVKVREKAKEKAKVKAIMSLIQMLRMTTMLAQPLTMMVLVQMTALARTMMTPAPLQTALVPPMARTLPMVPTHLMVQTARRKKKHPALRKPPRPVVRSQQPS